MQPFLTLSERWAVGADRQQWIVYRRGDDGPWKPVSFIGSTKAILLRVLREKDAVIGPEGQAALDCLPETFRAWQRGRHSAVGAQPHPGSREAA